METHHARTKLAQDAVKGAGLARRPPRTFVPTTVSLSLWSSDSDIAARSPRLATLDFDLRHHPPLLGPAPPAIIRRQARQQGDALVASPCQPSPILDAPGQAPFESMLQVRGMAADLSVHQYDVSFSSSLSDMSFTLTTGALCTMSFE